MEIPNAKHICSSDTTWVWVNNVSLQPVTHLFCFCLVHLGTVSQSVSQNFNVICSRGTADPRGSIRQY